MSADDSFQAFIRRVRAGDQDAAAELVRHYEPEIRRAIRIRLTNPRLRRLLDSVDICQSVLANFFVRAASGQFDLDKPEQLLKLLVTMARNRLHNEVDRQQAERRDCRRLQPDGAEDIQGVRDPRASPSQIAGGKELLALVRQRLSPEEVYLADQRLLGRNWPELADELGTTPEALRKRYTRALDRVAQELGLEDSSHA